MKLPFEESLIVVGEIPESRIVNNRIAYKKERRADMNVGRMRQCHAVATLKRRLCRSFCVTPRDPSLRAGPSPVPPLWMAALKKGYDSVMKKRQRKE
ncbi:MAG TPA: hypothetical protein VFG46_29395 [Chryseolinea sp.]|nr:hypothetical protein [Chryseolinea sp.]